MSTILEKFSVFHIITQPFTFQKCLLITTLISLLCGCGGATESSSDLSTENDSVAQLTTPDQSASTTPNEKPTSRTWQSDPSALTPDLSTTSTLPSEAMPPSSSKTISSLPTEIVSPPNMSVDNSSENANIDLFHEGHIQGEFELQRGLVADTSRLTAINSSNPLYNNYYTDGVHAFRMLPNNGNNDFYPVRSRLYAGFDEEQVTQELFGIYHNWSSMTLLSPATPTISSYVALRQKIFNYEMDFQDNRIDLDNRIVHSGTKSLRVLAVKPTAALPITKTSVDNEILALRKNTLVNITTWFYIAEGSPTGLIDLECEFIKESPGIRLLLSDQLEPRIEMKWGSKASYRPLSNIDAKIPRNQWVKLALYLALTDNANGVMQVRINNNLVIDARGQTLFDANGLYNRMQLGITANTANSNAVVYVDDVNFNSAQY